MYIYSTLICVFPLEMQKISCHICKIKQLAKLHSWNLKEVPIKSKSVDTLTLGFADWPESEPYYFSWCECEWRRARIFFFFISLSSVFSLFLLLKQPCLTASHMSCSLHSNRAVSITSQNRKTRWVSNYDPNRIHCFVFKGPERSSKNYTTVFSISTIHFCFFLSQTTSKLKTKRVQKWSLDVNVRRKRLWL